MARRGSFFSPQRWKNKQVDDIGHKSLIYMREELRIEMEVAEEDAPPPHDHQWFDSDRYIHTQECACGAMREHPFKFYLEHPPCIGDLKPDPTILDKS